MAVAANRESSPKETEVVGRMGVRGMYGPKFRTDLRTIELLSHNKYINIDLSGEEKENLVWNLEKYQYLMVT